MNPAAPVTTTLASDAFARGVDGSGDAFASPRKLPRAARRGADAPVLEASRVQLEYRPDVARVDDLGRAHAALQLVQVGVAEVTPLGHQDERVGAVDAVVLVVEVARLGRVVA